ncbi:MAG TPA: penicillin-binding transpeptidase domain-containing protein, partial [Candidatus Babeliales bacterium]|nr:penicillin-binding transpeptidase domain-containing protein [Candidatus Babeliales bacterium]
MQFKFWLLALSFISQPMAAQVAFLARENGATIQQIGDCSSRHTPWCSFNIALSLMAYESGVLLDAQRPVLPYELGYQAGRAVCQQAQTPTSWIKNSCVWYSRALTQQLELATIRNYLAQFAYGNQDFSGDVGQNNGLTHAWLGSSLHISANEQVTLVEKILQRAFTLAPATYAYTQQILFAEHLTATAQLYGKTGSGPFGNPNIAQAALTDGAALQHGWFVGW